MGLPPSRRHVVSSRLFCLAAAVGRLMLINAITTSSKFIEADMTHFRVALILLFHELDDTPLILAISDDRHWSPRRAGAR